MAKYSKKKPVECETIHGRNERGKLRSGRSGKKVTNPRQAIAIGLSEARKAGAKCKESRAKKEERTGEKTARAKKALPKDSIHHLSVLHSVHTAIVSN